MVENARLGAAMGIGAAVSSGIRELKTDQQSVIRASCKTMLFNQCGPQSCQALLGMRRGQKLIGIGAACVGDRHRLSTPDQFRTAAAEALPAPDRVLARVAVRQAVPPFHGLNCDPVANFDSTADQWHPQWRLRSTQKLAITGERQTERLQMFLETRHVLHCPEPQDWLCAHAPLRSGKPNTATAPSRATPTSRKQLVE